MRHTIWNLMMVVYLAAIVGLSFIFIASGFENAGAFYLAAVLLALGALVRTARK